MTLTLEDVSVTYHTSDGTTLPALGLVSTAVLAGQFVALLGTSGCGKSTLARVVGGLQPPTTGRARFEGTPITRPLPQIGIMFQEPHLMGWRTVRDNVGLALELAGVPQATRYADVQALLPLLGLQEFADAYPRELSGGMAQRVALGRVLAQRPRLLILDEPFGALDALTREVLRADVLRLWQAQRQTVLMVTHDIQEAVWMADRILVLSRRPGRIIADIDVPLPRPRTLDMAYTSEFAALAKRVREAIDYV